MQLKTFLPNFFLIQILQEIYLLILFSIQNKRDVVAKLFQISTSIYFKLVLLFFCWNDIFLQIYNLITVSTPIVRRRFIKNLRFFGGGLLKFFGFLPQKALKSGLLRQKNGGLFKFGCSGGLIKSGVLQAWIRYSEHTFQLNNSRIES